MSNNIVGAPSFSPYLQLLELLFFAFFVLFCGYSDFLPPEPLSIAGSTNFEMRLPFIST
jgi:hypothetical protein